MIHTTAAAMHGVLDSTARCCLSLSTVVIDYRKNNTSMLRQNGSPTTVVPKVLGHMSWFRTTTTVLLTAVSGAPNLRT